MEFSGDILIQITIIVLGLCGFLVAKHIYDHKTKNTPLVCPVGFDCHAVVHSDYSRFLGVRVEIFGMVYYALVSIVYLLLFFISESMPDMVSSFLVLTSFGAFIFSVYLILIQTFVLKKGCSWCIVSALISTIIFILIALNYDFNPFAPILFK